MLRRSDGILADIAIAGVLAGVLVAACAVIQTRLDQKRQTYFSDTPLSRQISYCYFKGEYHPKDPKHRKETWSKEGYLPCYFIPHQENI
jgi:hypothetical protein